MRSLLKDAKQCIHSQYGARGTARSSAAEQALNNESKAFAVAWRCYSAQGRGGPFLTCVRIYYAAVQAGSLLLKYCIRVDVPRRVSRKTIVRFSKGRTPAPRTPASQRLMGKVHMGRVCRGGLPRASRTSRLVHG